MRTALRRLPLALLVLAVIAAPPLGAQEKPKSLLPGQQEDGRWLGNPDAQFTSVAATGLTLLAYLGNGETHKHGTHKAEVKAGLVFLKSQQRKDGCFVNAANATAVRDHAIATLAMAEVYALTGSPLFKASSQNAVDWLKGARRADLVWGFLAKAEAPALEPTAFAVMALKSAKSAGLRVDDSHAAPVLTFLGTIADPAPREAAMSILIRLFLGANPRKSAEIEAAVKILLANLPVWDETAPAEVFDALYWYFGTLSCFQVGGDTWKIWNDALKPAVIDHQIREGDRKGEWDLVGAWAKSAGPAANNALFVMCMSVYYRYPRVFGGKGGAVGKGGGAGGAFKGRAGRRAVPPPSTGGTTEPNDNPYGDVFYKHYGVNPFVDTEDDALSTFAMDVDTASYAVTRRYLADGNLPDPASVRVEEFVNSFPPDDPAPESGVFGLAAEGMPAPYASSRYHLLRLSVRAKDVRPKDRKPAILTFVVDISGSMNRENRLGLVKRALRLLVSRLKPEDRVALVVYGSRGEVLLSHTEDLDAIVAAIEALGPGGSTNAEEGLRLGFAEAAKGLVEGANNRVILCSDGVANVGRTGPDSILSVIAKHAKKGIDLTTIGFGMGNYNDVLMEQLADKGNGSYAYVDTMNEARRVFVQNLTGTLQTVARDAKVQVEFDPEVVSRYRLLGYENRDVKDEDFRKDDVDAGEVGAGQAVTALYEIKLAKDAPEGRALGTFRVRYRPADGGEKVIEEAVPVARAILDAAPSRRFRIQAAVAEFAEILRGSYWARDGSLTRVRDDLAAIFADGEADPAEAELLDLVTKAAARKPAGDAPAPEERPRFTDGE